MLDSYQAMEENTPVDGGESTQFQLPPRDISMDMERIVEHLPGKYLRVFHGSLFCGY